MENNNNLVSMIVSFLTMFASGIFFAILYYIMVVTETAFKNMSCTIHNNIYVSSCQQLWSLSLYPFLAMKDILVWFSFFFIFALVLGILISGYKSGNSPVLMGVLVIFISVITYIGIEISNIYRTMLANDVFRQMMVNFTVYNNIMLYFPWFTFVVGIMAVMLGVVNYQRSNTNKAEDFNY